MTRQHGCRPIRPRATIVARADAARRVAMPGQVLRAVTSDGLLRATGDVTSSSAPPLRLTELGGPA